MALLLKLSPILLAIAYAMISYRFSAWRLARDLNMRSRPLDDPILAPIVRRLGLAAGVGEIGAHIYDLPVLNGLAAPDGRIFITAGLFEKYRERQVSAEEIASVIAHELGHVALGHHRRRMISWAGQNAARAALSVLLARFIPYLGRYLVAMALRLITAKLSRVDEFEADAYASALMWRAGLDSGAQLTLLEKLPRLVPAFGGAAWLASHPPIPDRVAAINQRLAAWRNHPPATT